MKATKNSVLKYSPYTAALTRALKSHSNQIHCMTDETGSAVYVCNGYFLAKLNPLEYDALVRPVTQREAGNWVIDQNGETQNREPIDLARMLTDEGKNAAHAVTAAPFLFDTQQQNKTQLVCCYSETGDFVSGYNVAYVSIISGTLARKAKGPTAPMVIYTAEDEPAALILPVRLTKPEINRAVRAYFTDSPAADELTEARRRINELENQARSLENQRDEAQRLADDLTHQLTDQLQQLTESVQQPAVEEPQDKTAALVDKLNALDGVTATVKGAKTAAPVVWLSGNADAHKDEIERMGGKWSGKRSAWYFRA